MSLLNGAWPVAASFDIDARTATLLLKLQKRFGVDTNAAVISRALALADIASEHAGPDNTVTITGDGQEPVKVRLAG
jgi:hypothetical protein